MRALIWILGILFTLVPAKNAHAVVIPPMPTHEPIEYVKHEREPIGSEQDAYDDAWCEFTNLFNSYETKWSKNGRLMIRSGNSGSFKFAKKGI